MSPVILRTSTRLLMPLLLLFSLFLLLRGHNAPGGGFVGGLVTAAAFALYALAFDVDQARQTLYYSPRSFIGTGMILALASGLIAAAAGEPFMTGLWLEQSVPVLGKLGTPLLFDIGVFLVVVGVVLVIVFNLADEEETDPVKEPLRENQTGQVTGRG
jgi:multicomponent Na+:H+ antiporter subunit B